MAADIDRRRRSIIGDEHYCPVCGYDLVAQLKAERTRCPECGSPFDPWNLAPPSPPARGPEVFIAGVFWVPALLIGAANHPRTPEGLLGAAVFVVSPAYCYTAAGAAFARRGMVYPWAFAVIPAIALWVWSLLLGLAATVTGAMVFPDGRQFSLPGLVSAASYWFVAIGVALKTWHKSPGSWLNWGEAAEPNRRATESRAGGGGVGRRPAGVPSGAGLGGRSPGSGLMA
jgi:hypothetical protein